MLQYKLHSTLLANYSTILQVRYHGEQWTMPIPWPLHATRETNTNATLTLNQCYKKRKEVYIYRRLQVQDNKF